ncbi:MAG TPA: cupin domain-containing protein [Chloroflexota bacterium]|nr:cupin domain-containing protein [Chloroflexota bacterium]
MPIDRVFGLHASTPPVELPGGVLRRTLVWGERLLFVEFRVPQGAGVPRHNHPHEQVGYVVSGRLEFAVGDDERVLGPGDAYVIPSDVPHHSRALEDSVVIDVFSPVREDYLPRS